jgi:hypothetical protein
LTPSARSTGLSERDALAVVKDAADRLWTLEASAFLTYLTDARGLSVATIKDAQLGWVSSLSVRRASGSGSFRVAGWVVPWFDGDRLVLLKLRQPNGFKPKYAEIYRYRGRHTGVYPGLGSVKPGRALVVTEGEFDCLLLAQELVDLASVVTLGSASERPTAAALARMLAASGWYLAHDRDPAGDKAADAWPAGARRVRPPVGKDWTEAKKGVGLRRWWGELLAGNPSPEIYTWDELSTWRWGPAVGDSESGVDVPAPRPFRQTPALARREAEMRRRGQRPPDRPTPPDNRHGSHV